MHTTRRALADRLSEYGKPVEIGVGRRPDVAAALADGGASVTTTDIHRFDVPDGVRFVRDDVTDPEFDVYADADVVYALNCPPELQRPLRTVASGVGAECLFTTLGGDPAVVEATPEQLPGETLFHVKP